MYLNTQVFEHAGTNVSMGQLKEAYFIISSLKYNIVTQVKQTFHSSETIIRQQLSWDELVTDKTLRLSWNKNYVLRWSGCVPHVGTFPFIH